MFTNNLTTKLERETKRLYSNNRSFNARAQHKISEDEECIGPHVFDTENITVHQQTEELQQNRERFIEMNTIQQLQIMNTKFRKQPQKLIIFQCQYEGPTQDIKGCVKTGAPAPVQTQPPIP